MARLEGDWPRPDPDALALSGQLRTRIEAAIADQGGTLPFDRFMAMALYEPGLGYYSGGLAKFGAAGDFITAPELSPVFSRTIAHQVAECLGHWPEAGLLELGPGNGTMAVEVMLTLERLDCLPERLALLEVSGSLRQVQRERFQADAPHLLDRVVWLDRLPEPGCWIVLANEVMDALPVSRFRIGDDQTVEEAHVSADRDGFGWGWRPASDSLTASVQRLQAGLDQPLPAGYASELCQPLPAWLGSLADCLRPGVAFLIDYGYPRREYYHPQRHMGTLVCHYRHRAHDDPLWMPGLQDITAFVDFTAAAEAGVEAGLEVLGYAPQAHFLMGAGLDDVLREAMQDAERAPLAVQQAKQLTLPGEMGERFQVLAVGRDYPGQPRGFRFFDHRHRL